MGLEMRRGGTTPDGQETLLGGGDEDSLSSPLPSRRSRLLCPQSGSAHG